MIRDIETHTHTSGRLPRILASVCVQVCVDVCNDCCYYYQLLLLLLLPLLLLLLLLPPPPPPAVSNAMTDAWMYVSSCASIEGRLNKLSCDVMNCGSFPIRSLFVWYAPIRTQSPDEKHGWQQSNHMMDSLRGSSVKLGTIQRKLAWPLRKDDAHKSRSVNDKHITW